MKIDGKSAFYKKLFLISCNIKYTVVLLSDMSNIESFNVARDAGITNSNFLVWTGHRRPALRQFVPLKLRQNMPISRIFLIFKILNVMITTTGL